MRAFATKRLAVQRERHQARPGARGGLRLEEGQDLRRVAVIHRDAGGLGHRFPTGELAVPAEDDLAAIDGVEAVGDAAGVLHVRFGDEHRDAERLDRAHGLDEARDHHRRQALERLVEQQHGRLERQRSRDGEHLLLTAREVKAPPSEERLDLREHGEDLGGRLLAEPRRDVEILLHREVGEDPAVLRRVSDAQPRALVLNPELLLLDEPSAGLDPVIASVIDELIISLSEKSKVTSITATHEMDSAFRIATRMAMLYEGKIIEEGEPEQLKQSKNPVVAQFLSGSTEGPILEGSLDAIRKK